MGRRTGHFGLERAERMRLVRNATVSSALVGGVVCGAVGFVVAAVVAMGDAARSR